MRERPIPMSAPMVKAILAGTKTQTRRVVKPQPDTRHGMNCTRLVFKDRKGALLLDEALEAPEPVLYRSLCPYGQPGDRLWVREAWRTVAEADALPPRDLTPAHRLWYEANSPHQPGAGKYRPPMFMPRWSSRITLEVTGVRVERLQDISAADAAAEGCYVAPKTGTRQDYQQEIDDAKGAARRAYRNLWEQINGPGSWDSNPWVWVVEFKRVAP